MAEHGVCHRDLKSENMMINPDTFIIKLIDFSLATEIESLDDFDDSYRGTPLYMAPEVLVQEGLLYRVLPSEIWSLGVIYWECIIGENPFAAASSKKELFQMQMNAEDAYTNLSESAQTVLYAILQIDPAQRVSLQQAKIIIEAVFSDARRSAIINPTRPYSTERTRSVAADDKDGVVDRFAAPKPKRRNDMSELSYTTPATILQNDHM